MSTNAAGLKPEETKALKERPVRSHEQPVIMAIREAYILFVQIHWILLISPSRCILVQPRR